MKIVNNEVRLISRIVLLGDKDAFNLLVEGYQSPIRRFLFNLTEGNEELSKDLAQEIFIKAWLNINSFRAASKFSTWLYRIAYNTFYDYARTKRNLASLDDVSDIFVMDGFDSDSKLDFMRSLKILKNDEKTAMLLFYMEDLTVKKISQIMNKPNGTIKSLLFRGKEKLANYFKNSGYDK